MSNALYKSYGEALSSPWFTGMRSMCCAHPNSELGKLDELHPMIAALYFLGQNAGVSYIGISGTRQSGGLFRRLRQHCRTSTRIPFRFAYAFLPTAELNEWETAAISSLQPEFNQSKRNYHAACSDHLDEMISFLDQRHYFRLFPNAEIYRISFGRLD